VNLEVHDADRSRIYGLGHNRGTPSALGVCALFLQASDIRLQEEPTASVPCGLKPEA
jgi:hypothetical protein